MVRTLACAALVCSLVASACVPMSPSASPRATLIGDVRLPSHRELDAYPTGLIEGQLVLDGECVILEPSLSGIRYLPVWPPGATRTGDAVIVDGVVVATVGSDVALGGGHYGGQHFAFLRTLMEDEVPDACRIGDYWLVSEVVPAIDTRE